MQQLVHAIIVTHNSGKVILPCLDAIEGQSEAVSSITIVDSGSHSTDYLDAIEQRVTRLIKSENVGFARANNIGFTTVNAGEPDFILFINPDAFLHPDAVLECLKLFGKDSKLGCVTGKLLGFDLVGNRSSGHIDSTGIFRRWYGRWYDRGQGHLDTGQYDQKEYVPAVCGALMCCRESALSSFKDKVFDDSFFLYKEDIELSLRLRNLGWKLLYSPKVMAYHCRGWNTDRKEMAYEQRLYSAENEVKLYMRHPSVYILWAIVKYVAVRFFRI